MVLYQSCVFAELIQCFGYLISWVISCSSSDYINCTVLEQNGGIWMLCLVVLA